MTLKFDRWPWKTIGHLSQYTSSFVHRLIAIGEFKLGLQSENAQFGPKSAFFCPVWPWNLADDLWYGKSEGFYSCDRPSNPKLDSNCRFVSPCDLEILWMTSKNNMTHLLYNIKLCTSFQIHRWSQTWVTVRKRSIRVEIDGNLSRVTLKLDGWSWKTKGHPFYTTLSFVHHFKSIGEVKLELQSGNTQFGSKSTLFCPVWPWNWTDNLEKQ